MMQFMEQIAATPAIIASNPGLFAKIKAANAKYSGKTSESDIAQLAQFPNAGRSILPRNNGQILNNTVSSNNSGGGNPPLPPGFPPEDNNASPN